MLARFLRVADLGLPAHTPGDINGLVVDRALYQKPRRRIAGLAGIVEAFEHAAGNAFLEIGILEDDVGRLAAEFERDALDGVGRILADGGAGPGRAGERHHVDVLVLRQGGTDIRAVAIDQIEGAGREAGLMHHLGIKKGVERGELRGLEHAGRARRERRNDLEGDLVDRPIPRSDEAADADRLAEHDVAVRQLLAHLDALERVDEALQMADADMRLLFGAHGDRRTEFERDGARHLVIAALVDGEQIFEQRDALVETGGGCRS